CGSTVDTTPINTDISHDYRVEDTYRELPTLDFQTGIKLCFNNYFNFNGRSRRSEFWWFSLLGFLIGFLGIIPIIGSLISLIGSLVLLIPSLAVGARRLHDIDKTGWWQALLYSIMVIGTIMSIIFLVVGLLLVGVMLLIVTIGLIILFIYWFTKPGDKGPNRFGEDPRQVYEPIHQPAKR
ncbi:DUF805 domain-containing protein, partial [Dehalococcoidia bacterium]|nr:DUF805 domain-containing protein [Dehalococcoidia bacterium]